MEVPHVTVIGVVLILTVCPQAPGVEPPTSAVKVTSLPVQTISVEGVICTSHCAITLTIANDIKKLKAAKCLMTRFILLLCFIIKFIHYCHQKTGAKIHKNNYALHLNAKTKNDIKCCPNCSH